MPDGAQLSAIKKCNSCGRLFTGEGALLCLACLLTDQNGQIKRLAVVPELSRSERRALKKKVEREQKAAVQRNFPPLSVRESNQRTAKRLIDGSHREDGRFAPQVNNQESAQHHPRYEKSRSHSRSSNEPRKNNLPVACPLCGLNIAPGEMLKHKSKVHGELEVVPSPAKPINTNQWVSVYQGGLPSLGKGSR